MRTASLRIALSAIALAASAASHAQISGDKIRIGFVTDMSGPFADNDGPGGLEAIRMAVADFGGTVNGKQIEVLSADHQNKADIGIGQSARMGRHPGHRHDCWRRQLCRHAGHQQDGS